MANLKQTTAYTRMFFMVSSADHLAAKTGAAPVVNLSKAGAAFGAAAGTVTEITNGWYKVALTTVDTGTLGDLAYHITGTGADDADFVDTVTARSFDDLSAPGTAQTITANQSVSVAQWNGTNVTAPDTAGSPKVTITAGVGAGQLDFTAGIVKSNLSQILGTALTETAGQIAAAFKQFFNIASPTSTMNLITAVTTTTTATTATNLTNAPTAGDFTAAMKTSLNAATPVATVSGDFSATMKTSLNASTPASVTGAVGSVTGAVGSVTGAVASVTGNVGGNVVGSVASVTANVNADVKKINGTTVNGNGGVTPWGP